MASALQQLEPGASPAAEASAPAVEAEAEADADTEAEAEAEAEVEARAGSGTADGDATSADPGSAAAASHRVRTKEDLGKLKLERFATRELVHSAAMNESHRRFVEYSKRKRDEAQDYSTLAHPVNRKAATPARLYGVGYAGYGNGHTDGVQGILYPQQKQRLGHKKTKALRIKRRDVLEQADQIEELIPIRLDIDWDKVNLRDTFTWNLHDRTVPPELFATQLVEDFGLPPPAAGYVLEQVQQQLHEQIVGFYPPVYIEEEALDPELPYAAYKNDEMRILIKLNITIGPLTLEDKFEWDFNNPINSPEEFAQSMARDLSLSGEFVTAIAHCIREQSQLFIRSLYITGHPFDGRAIEDADLSAAFLPTPVPSAFRAHQQAKEFGPMLYESSDADLERQEVIFSREQRRQKRSVNRRGGPVLPDLKDRLRTVRTLVVSSVISGAAETTEESRLYKRVVTGRGKRANLRDGDPSDSEESEESVPESPALSQLQGTTRTRNMRGAAVNAQQRMANIGRSESPEATIVHHHETRTSARRTVRDQPEESVEPPTSLILKLKFNNRNKLEKLLEDLSRGTKGTATAQATSAFNSGPSQSYGTPVQGNMGPPSTPGHQHSQGAGSSATLPPVQAQIGAVQAPDIVPGQPSPPTPAPPLWLSAGLNTLKQQYPSDHFEGMMRLSQVNTASNVAVSASTPGATPNSDVKNFFLPRIRCLDCPGKLYTPGPEMTVQNFEVHLKNRQHRERVDERLARTRGPG